MKRFTQRAILCGGAYVDAPIGLRTDVLAHCHEPAGIGHERVDGEGAPGVEPVFVHAGFEAGGKRDEGVFEAGEGVPAGFLRDAATQGDEGFIDEVVQLRVRCLDVFDGDDIPALVWDFCAGGDGGCPERARGEACRGLQRGWEWVRQVGAAPRNAAHSPGEWEHGA